MQLSFSLVIAFTAAAAEIASAGGIAFGAHWRCRVFPGGGGVAFGVRLGCWVFPSWGEMSIRAQNGRQVFPGGGGVALGAHWEC